MKKVLFITILFSGIIFYNSCLAVDMDFIPEDFENLYIPSTSPIEYWYGNGDFGTTTDEANSPIRSAWISSSNGIITAYQENLVATTTIYFDVFQTSEDAKWYLEMSSIAGLWSDFICEDVTYWNPDTSSCDYLGELVYGDWNKIGFELDGSGETALARWSLNGVWGEWIETVGNAHNINTFQLHNGGGSGVIYIDDLATSSIEIEYCINYETKLECETNSCLWNWVTEECNEELPDCSEYIYQADCTDYEYYTYGIDNRCYWNYASSTCETTPTCTFANWYYCDNVSDCQNASGTWALGYDLIYHCTGGIEYGWNTSTTSTAPISEAEFKWETAITDPSSFFSGIWNTLNPFSKPPYTWVGQFAQLIYYEYQLSASSTLQENTDYASNTFGVVDFLIMNSTGSTSTLQVRFINFEWAKTGKWLILFERLKQIFAVMLWFSTGILLFKYIPKWFDAITGND